jgi:rhodanese-related sulfurtransferase
MDRNVKLGITVSVVIVIAVSIFWMFQPQGDEAAYGDVNVEQASDLIKSRLLMVILDVRTTEEFAIEHIEGAINIPVDELENRIGELDKKDELLVYCRTGSRSSRAVDTLTKNGFTKIFHMNGGIVAWKNAGFLTVK